MLITRFFLSNKNTTSGGVSFDDNFGGVHGVPHVNILLLQNNTIKIVPITVTLSTIYLPARRIDD